MSFLNAPNPLRSGSSGSSSSGIINWDDINGRPTFNNVSRRDVQKVVLKADGWDEDSKQSAAALTVVEDETKQQIMPVPTEDSYDPYYDSNIMITGQGKGEVFFKADTKPTEDVNVLVFIEETVNVSEAYNGKWVWWSPKMTSNTTPEPYKVDGNLAINGPTLYYLFDGKNTSVSCSLNKYGTIDFGSSIYISGIRMMAANPDYFPNRFVIEGSDDNDNWNVIYQSNGDEYETVLKGKQYDYFFEIVNYRYYRIMFTGTFAGIASVNVGHIEFYKWEEAEQ